MNIKKVSYLLLSSVFVIMLIVSINNTTKWARDFYGLTILTSLSSEDLSYNPFSKDFSWISPSMALYILKTREYPYESCSDMTIKFSRCGEPKIEIATRFIGIVSREAEDRIFELIKFLIEKREPIDAYSSEGYTALQAAILSNEPELVSLLLKSGANPYLPIKRDSSVYGKNSIEFVDLLIETNKADFSKVKEIMVNNLSRN